MTIQALMDSAVRHHQAGRLREADAFYRQVLSIDPNHANALHLLGIIASQIGRREAALTLIRRAIAADSSVPDFHVNLGVELEAAGTLTEALAAYRSALALDPRHALAHNNVGNVLFRMEKNGEAVIAFRRALDLQPDYVEAQANLGSALFALGRYSEAIDACQVAIRRAPDYVPGHYNLGNAFKAVGSLQEAEAAYRAALAIQPNLALVHVNLGNVQFADGRVTEAISSYEKAIALQPYLAEAHSNLGNALRQAGRNQEGIVACQTAISLQPDLPLAHLNLSVMLLAQGDFAEGWPEYEWRWKTADHWPPRRDFGVSEWRGEELGGRRILLHAEQGFGDSIQFIRYVRFVAERGGNIILECPLALVRLLDGVSGISECIAYGEPLPLFDCHCPILSLPLIFATTLATIPANTPYLVPDASRALLWQQRMAVVVDRIKVGLCWAGRPEHSDDRNRSMHLSTLRPLFTAPDTWFCSLQIGEATGQIAEVTTGVLAIIDWTAELRDFQETAALISELDLVITVDTAIAHLAGALGKRVWVLLPFVADWRWLRERSDSPWYPTMRLFRQSRPGDWTQPIAEMTDALATLRTECVPSTAANKP